MQITVILALMITLGVGDWAADDEIPAWMGYFSGFNALALLLGIIVLAGSLMRLTSRHLVKRLESTNPPSRANLRLPGRVDLLLRTGILIMFAAVLTAGGWGRLVIKDWHLDRLVLLDEICLMLPFMVLLVLHWYNFYPVKRFIREYVVAGQLIDGLWARPVWSRRQYLAFFC